MGMPRGGKVDGRRNQRGSEANEKETKRRGVACGGGGGRRKGDKKKRNDQRRPISPHNSFYERNDIRNAEKAKI